MQNAHTTPSLPAPFVWREESLQQLLEEGLRRERITHAECISTKVRSKHIPRPRSNTLTIVDQTDEVTNNRPNIKTLKFCSSKGDEFNFRLM